MFQKIKDSAGHEFINIDTLCNDNIFIRGKLEPKDIKIAGFNNSQNNYWNKKDYIHVVPAVVVMRLAFKCEENCVLNCHYQFIELPMKR